MNKKILLAVVLLGASNISAMDYSGPGYTSGEIFTALAYTAVALFIGDKFIKSLKQVDQAEPEFDVFASQEAFIRKQALLLSKGTQENPIIQEVENIAASLAPAPTLEPSFSQKTAAFIGNNKYSLTGAIVLMAGALYGGYKLYGYLTKPTIKDIQPSDVD